MKLGVAIGITVVTSGVASGAFTVFGFTATTTTAAAFGTAVAGGALAGAVTGGLKRAVTGALGAAGFFGVGEYFSNLGYAQQLAQSGEVTQGLSRAGLTAGQTVAKIAAHATVGGTMSVLQGGKFGHGMIVKYQTSQMVSNLSGQGGMMHAHPIQPLFDKLKELPPQRVAEVEDFVDFLRDRDRVKSTTTAHRESFAFPVISVGQWAEGLSLRREDMYGDDGR